MQPQQPEQKEKQQDSKDPTELRHAQAFYYFLRIRGCQTICSHCVYGLYGICKEIQKIPNFKSFRKHYSRLRNIWSESIENEYCPPCLKPIIQAFEEAEKNGNDQYPDLRKLRNSLRRDMTRILSADGKDDWGVYLDFSARIASVERYLEYYTRNCESSCDIIARLRHDAYVHLDEGEACMAISAEPCREWKNYLLFQATMLIGILNIPLGRHDKRLFPDDDFRTTNKDCKWEVVPEENPPEPFGKSSQGNYCFGQFVREQNWDILSGDKKLNDCKTADELLRLLNERHRVYKLGVEAFPEEKLLPELLRDWNKLVVPNEGSMAKWFLKTRKVNPPNYACLERQGFSYVLLPLMKDDGIPEQRDALSQLEAIAKIYLQTEEKKNDFHKAFCNCRPQKLLLFSGREGSSEKSVVNGEVSNGHPVCQLISACCFPWNQMSGMGSFICLGESFGKYCDRINNRKFNNFLENRLKKMLIWPTIFGMHKLDITVVFSENQRKTLRPRVKKRFENLAGNPNMSFQLLEVSENAFVRLHHFQEAREELKEPEQLGGKDLSDLENWFVLRDYRPLEEWGYPKDSPRWNKLPKYERQNIRKWIYDNACWMLQGLFIKQPRNPMEDNMLIKSIYENAAADFEEAKNLWTEKMKQAFDVDKILPKMKTYPLYSQDWNEELPDVLRGPQGHQKLDEEAGKEKKKKGRPFMKVWYQTSAEMTDRSASMLNAARFITLAFGIIKFLRSGKLNMTTKDFLKISRGYYDQMRAIEPLRESHSGNGKNMKKTRNAAQGKKRTRTPKYKGMNDFLWKTIVKARI